jgi:hypothetical protein
MFMRFPKNPFELHALILETTLIVVMVIEAIRFIANIIAG